MSKKKNRKPTPQPPKWFWYDNDSCWNCENRNGCRNCKILKEQKAAEKEKLNKKEKQKIKMLKYEGE